MHYCNVCPGEVRMSHKPNALKSRLISFFMQNPTEELTVDDICI